MATETTVNIQNCLERLQAGDMNARDDLLRAACACASNP